MYAFQMRTSTMKGYLLSILVHVRISVAYILDYVRIRAHKHGSRIVHFISIYRHYYYKMIFRKNYFKSFWLCCIYNRCVSPGSKIIFSHNIQYICYEYGQRTLIIQKNSLSQLIRTQLVNLYKKLSICFISKNVPYMSYFAHKDKNSIIDLFSARTDTKLILASCKFNI